MTYATLTDNQSYPDPTAARTHNAPEPPRNPASDFALPEALKAVAVRHADEVVRKVGEALAEDRRASEKKKSAIFHRRLHTDSALCSRFRTSVAQHAVRNGISEREAYPVILTEFLKES